MKESSRQPRQRWVSGESCPDDFVVRCASGNNDLVLGVAEEHTILLNSNHLGVSKFANSLDTNFAKVRDALVKAVDNIEEECTLRYDE